MAQEAEYTVDGYLTLRESLDAVDESLAEVDATDPRVHVDAVVDVIDAVHALGYLNGWSESGQMPEGLIAESRSQRFVLFENLV